MFVILVYDINADRVSKVMHICRKYLHPVQESAYEGTLTGKKLTSLTSDLNRVIIPEEDAISIYCLPGTKYVLKEEIGRTIRNHSVI